MQNLCKIQPLTETSDLELHTILYAIVRLLLLSTYSSESGCVSKKRIIVLELAVGNL